MNQNNIQKLLRLNSENNLLSNYIKSIHLFYFVPQGDLNPLDTYSSTNISSLTGTNTNNSNSKEELVFADKFFGHKTKKPIFAVQSMACLFIATLLTS